MGDLDGTLDTLVFHFGFESNQGESVSQPSYVQTDPRALEQLVLPPLSDFFSVKHLKLADSSKNPGSGFL